ncbi:MAG: SDR family oxidoreductase [Myxococcales bacterium]|nr:SDR family oxidoreductase [Myxococcales bacterium]
MPDALRDWLDDVFRDRPRWMNVALVFCAYMAFVYVPWDLFLKPVARDEEVWFGLLFRGHAAKVLEIPHWFVYGALAYGLRRMRPWAGTLAALYSAQIAFGMFVWNFRELEGVLLPLFLGTFGAVPFVLLAVAFWTSTAFQTPRPSLRDRYGDWALVTGASAGIGAEFARALARDGMNVALSARREDRLRELATEIEARFGVETRVVAADLATPDGAERLAREVESLPVAVLVNNAGVGYAGRFDAQDASRIRALVQTNCTAPAELACRLLPGMRERGRGAVVFTGSVAGRQPLPLHAAYSASKSFDNLLAEALYVETRGTGIDVLSLEPGSTVSEFHDIAGELPHEGEPADRVVATALDALGRQPSVVSGWFNYLRATLPPRILSRTQLLYIARDVVRGQTPERLR